MSKQNAADFFNNLFESSNKPQEVVKKPVKHVSGQNPYEVTPHANESQAVFEQYQPPPVAHAKRK